MELERLSRVLCRHQWAGAEEWAAAVRRLGELDEGELATLIGCCSDDAPRLQPAPARP